MRLKTKWLSILANLKTSKIVKDTPEILFSEISNSHT